MKDSLIQPAATLAAVLLQRLSPKEELTEGVISSAFIQAYEALEKADLELGKTASLRATKHFEAMG